MLIETTTVCTVPKMIFAPAFVSGLCAALASTFGKLSGLEYNITDNRIEHFIKICCFIAMIALNGLMWSFFVRALQSSKSSLEATILNTATNYISSGLLAYFIFGEVTGVLWWSGISLILLGVIFVSQSAPNHQAKHV